MKNIKNYLSSLVKACKMEKTTNRPLEDKAMTLVLRRQPPSKELLEELNKEGISTLEISKRFQTTPKTVTKWYAFYNIPRYRSRELLRHFLGATDSRLKKMVKEKYSVTQIAEYFEVGYNTVVRWLEMTNTPRPNHNTLKLLSLGVNKEQLEKLAQQKLTRKEIADKLGISVGRLDKLYHLHGVAKPMKFPKKAPQKGKHPHQCTPLKYKLPTLGITKELFESFDKEGLSVYDIAKRLGVNSPNTIKAWYVQLGIRRPTTLERHIVQKGFTLEQFRQLVEQSKSKKELLTALNLSSPKTLEHWLTLLAQIPQDTNQQTKESENE